MYVVAAGISFRTAPLAVRERVVVEAERAATVLRYLVGHAGLSAAAVLSTCNRTEFYVIAPTDDLADEVMPRLGRYLDAEGHDVSGYLTGYRDADALRHIFRVAAGLDSKMVGETQVLGQFKKAHRLALDAGCLDAGLDFILRRALSLGKRVHSQQLMGSVRRGLADAAVEYAVRRWGSLTGRRVVVVGAGETARSVAGLVSAGGADLVIAARGPSGERLADLHRAPSVKLDALAGLENVDAIISCTSSTEPVIGRAAIEQMQSHRDRSQPLLVIDLAVPRDIAPGVADVSGVDLVDVDVVGDFGGAGVTGEGLVAAEAVVDAEVTATAALLQERETAGRAIAAMAQWAERTRAAELARTLDRMPELSSEQAERLDAFSQSLVRKLLHSPIAALRDAGDDRELALTLLHAFDLGAEEDDAADLVGTETAVAASR